MAETSRYIIGIDLGTTNTCLAFVDTASSDEQRPRAFPLLQHIAPGQTDQRPQLPSFMYLAAGPEFVKNALDLPWATGRQFSIGELARVQGAQVPARLIFSAKSWLCHGGVNRTAPILPWQAPADVPLLSPLDAQTKYLEHLRDAWNHLQASHDSANRLEEQEIFLTVPASFDAVARELTLRAAHQAGLKQVTIIEEPQAAFYSWLSAEGDKWRDQLAVGDVVLVCDIGGGTSDFSLIAVTEEQGNLALERIAVGNHILLGGDNMDLALAFAVAEKFAAQGHQLDPWQTRALWFACRVAKEQILANPDVEEAPVTILGRGAKVIGGAITAPLTRLDIQKVLLAGFFPACQAGDLPTETKRSGFQEIGLPYATDAAITRHLAKFLSSHQINEQHQFIRPTAILFNGGVMKSEELRGRIAEVINSWLSQAQAPSLKELPIHNLDLAVALGAAYYGLARRGHGIRIRGGSARSYYVGIESAMPAVPGMSAPLKALCVAPFGMEEGTSVEITGREFGMLVGEEAEFRFLSSTTRKEDAPGVLIESWADGELQELAPIHTAMTDPHDAPGTMVPVQLKSSLSEVGTLDLALHSRDGRKWQLEYFIRAR